jgi:hypothetical protein
MKRFILILFAGFLLLGFVYSQEQTTDWQRFSVNLVNAFKIPNDGLHQSAMGMIIRYADKLDVDDAVFDIVRIFRSHKDSRVRQLALVTLHKMQNEWAMDFLKRHQKYEKNETIRKLNCCIVNSYYAGVTPAQPADTVQVLSLQQ